MCMTLVGKTMLSEPKRPVSNVPGTIGKSDKPNGLRGQSPDVNEDITASSVPEHEGVNLPKVGNFV